MMNPLMILLALSLIGASVLAVGWWRSRQRGAVQSEAFRALETSLQDQIKQVTAQHHQEFSALEEKLRCEHEARVAEAISEGLEVNRQKEARLRQEQAELSRVQAGLDKEIKQRVVNATAAERWTLGEEKAAFREQQSELRARERALKRIENAEKLVIWLQAWHPMLVDKAKRELSGRLWEEEAIKEHGARHDTYPLQEL